MKSISPIGMGAIIAGLLVITSPLTNADNNGPRRAAYDSRQGNHTPDNRARWPSGPQGGHSGTPNWPTRPRPVVGGGYHRPYYGPHYYPHWNYSRWHSGYWHHGYYGTRLGWWWVVGSSWYLYPRAVYPYPEPVYVPPTVIVQPPRVETPQAAPPVQYWYFCASANEYYPYVSSCREDWQPVPATPE